ncbi:DUF4430 domain-containing protein [Crassaminicella profunda]|uniref:DUF4430 domain-containing protein n=1 Tax=Crassaminicella profunda TaxID=1286698 RepID=UPI001CA78761|nr:DUF4430 domain-containing protein [Crassaminicella profunda]QZY55699.1 DUF4430 domain-containing protein [Crassaminicella profunda]
MKRFLLFLLILVMACTFIGCGEKPSVGDGKVQVIVSKGFGNEKLSEKAVDVAKDTTVIEVMEENFNIETAYGGGFINGIDGLKSEFTGLKKKKKIDWFYYVNGILSEVGADEYYLNPNDLVIWDYHDWDNNIYGSSIIGAYPINFTNGHDGNIYPIQILYTKRYAKEGNALLKYLKDQGVKDIELVDLEQGELENLEKNSIVIGSWEELKKINYIKEFYENGNKCGLYFKVDEEIKGLNNKGETLKTYEKGAVVASVVKEYGGAASMWLVTGNDESSIKKAIKLLYENPEKIKGRFSVLVTEKEVINIPIKN